MRTPWVAAVVLILFAVPPASAQSLMNQLGDVHFPLITFTVDSDRVDVVGSDMEIRGTTASDLRRCIDNNGCPDPNVAALSAGNGDGTVSRAEVNSFSQALKDVIGLNPNAREFRTQVRELVSIDRTTASTIEFNEFTFRDANGPIDSQETVFFTVSLFARFDSVAEGDAHTVEIQRAESDLNVADRVVVEPARGWKIDATTVSPSDDASLLQDGRFEGSQDEFESSQPLTFALQEDNAGLSAGQWGLVGLGALVAGAVAFFVIRRRRRQTLI